MTEKTSIFRRPLFVSLFAILAATAWSWAYPLIKLGFAEFGINSDMTGSKMVFAGVRFTVSGIIVLLIAAAGKRSFAVSKPLDFFYILLFALLNTTIHYACFYIGLSHCPGARAAMLNSLGVFLLVILACIFFESDRMSSSKIIGCVLGFAGILSLNLGSAGSGRFTLMGDGMIILNAVCSACAGLLTRGLGKRCDIFVGTGYSLALGGLLLLICGLAMGGTLPVVTLWGVVILFLLICISTLGFSLYNKLISCNPVGKVAIYNSLIPVIGAVTSCLCLNEAFYWKYLVAGILSAGGIYIINREK